MLGQIKNDCLLARKSKDTVRATLLSTVIADIESIAKNGKREATEDDVTTVLKKFMKGLEEVLKVAPDNGLALAELPILKSYLPVAPTEEEMSKKIDEIISHGANTLGWIMKDLKFIYGSSLDGKLASVLIKGKLNVV
jgi:uncharacterized protein YqeY